MRLLLHNTLATSPFVFPVTAGWIESTPDLSLEPCDILTAAEVGVEDAALLSAPEIARLQETHLIVPEAAVVADAHGAVAMRCPVRPDEVERTPVRLLGASSGAEMLARATLLAFYGIEASGWSRADEDPGAGEAQVVVVEGAAALRPVEGGFTEDLTRAWFILTGGPVVSHLLVIPRGADASALTLIRTTMAALRATLESSERRRTWRTALVERHDLSRDSLMELFEKQRLALAPGDRLALLQLLQRGSQGMGYPRLAALPLLTPTIGT